MKIVVKKLQGGECTLEVQPDTYVSEIKQMISEKLDIPVEEQKLLLLGRTLVDEQTVEGYPAIKEGTKLNLVVKKPEGLYEITLKNFKRIGLSDADATCAAKRLLKIIEDKFYKLSWDEVERLSLDCLIDETGQSQSPPIRLEPDSDDVYSL